MIDLICQICGTSYTRTPSAAINSKHCSRKCHNSAAGTIGGKAGKGISRNMGVKRPDLTLRNLINNPTKRQREKHNWKGNNVGYVAMHNWAHLHVGLRNNCENCTYSKGLEMSNISGQYLREIDDWQTLCKKCHYWFDRRFRENGGTIRKLHRWKQKTSH